MQTSEIISVNIWQIVVSLLNLLLLLLILKKFLFKPVTNALNKRQSSIDTQYKEAEEARSSAEQSKKELEEQLSAAKDTADEIIKSATDAAERRGDKIVGDARDEADTIIRQARADAELEKRKAEEDIKSQIVDISALLTEKMLEREINKEDHRKLIDSFISEIGDISDEK